MRRHLLLAVLLWIILTAAAEYAVATFELMPLVAAREAEIIDEAFRFLMVLGIPVFTFVIAGLLYSVFAFRGESRELPGPTFRTSRPVTLSWFVITSGLAVFIIFNPGLKGLRELTEDNHQDLTIQVEAEQWQWTYTYDDYGVTIADADELVLPQGKRVRFEVISTDVIHSFWVPAFRMKIDAMPGQTNVLYVTPTELGSFGQDDTMRVQCAEMCGTGHPRMRTGVTVVSPEAFESWIQDQGG